MIVRASSHSASTSPMESPSGWHIPFFDPVLEPNAVHVWQADLDAASPLRRWERHLTPEEKAQAASVSFAHTRERFIVARGLLRELLALYTEKVIPSQFRFGYGAQGKPFLREQGSNSLFFNVSHSGSRALFGFASGGEVGVDIERIREKSDTQISESALSPPEKRVLCDLGGCAYHAAICKLWARKEAYVKADGRGLTQALHYLDVSQSEAAAEWGRVNVWHQESRAWCKDMLWNLRTLETCPGHAAAVVTQNELRQLSCWLWNN